MWMVRCVWVRLSRHVEFRFSFDLKPGSGR